MKGNLIILFLFESAQSTCCSLWIFLSHRSTNLVNFLLGYFIIRYIFHYCFGCPSIKDLILLFHIGLLSIMKPNVHGYFYFLCCIGFICLFLSLTTSLTIYDALLCVNLLQIWCLIWHDYIPNLPHPFYDVWLDNLRNNCLFFHLLGDRCFSLKVIF